MDFRKILNIFRYHPEGRQLLKLALMDKEQFRQTLKRIPPDTMKSITDTMVSSGVPLAGVGPSYMHKGGWTLHLNPWNEKLLNIREDVLKQMLRMAVPHEAGHIKTTEPLLSEFKQRFDKPDLSKYSRQDYNDVLENIKAWLPGDKYDIPAEVLADTYAFKTMRPHVKKEDMLPRMRSSSTYVYAFFKDIFDRIKPAILLSMLAGHGNRED